MTGSRYYRITEAFDVPSVSLDSAAAGNGVVSTTTVGLVCRSSDLESERQLLVNTFNTVVAQIQQIDASSKSVVDKASDYQTQLLTMSNVSDALDDIIEIFTGRAEISGDVGILGGLSALVSVLPSTLATLGDPKDMLNSAEDILRTAYSVSNALDKIFQNYGSLSVWNVGSLNRNTGVSKLVCLKNQVLSTTLSSNLKSLDTKISAFITSLTPWCSQLNSTAKTAVIPPSSPIDDAKFTCISTICNNVLGFTADTDYKSFVSSYNPSASTDQWQYFKNDVIHAKTSISDPGKLLAQISTSINKWIFTGCPSTPNVPSTLHPVGAIARSKPEDEGSKKMNAIPHDSSASCPTTRMSYDQQKGEYSISSHPEISDWGVQNSLWKGTEYIPDYAAQKAGIKSRCLDLNDFDITQHKDIKKYIPLSEFESLKNSANSMKHRLLKCDDSYARPCLDPLTLKPQPGGVVPKSAPISPAKPSLDQTHAMESFVPVAEDSSPAADREPIDPASYDISQHIQYPILMSSMTANSNLPDACKALIDCKTSPIQDNVNFSKYVLQSSIPACKSIADYKLSDHPDFAAYDDSWKGKYSVAADEAECDTQRRLASQPLEKNSSFAKYDAAWRTKFSDLENSNAKLTKMTCKDVQGEPMSCKTINDFPIASHNDFPKYTLASSCGTLSCPSTDFSNYDIKKHPDFVRVSADYDTCQKTSASIRDKYEKNINQNETNIGKLTSNLQSCTRANEDIRKASSSWQTAYKDISKHPSFQNYVLKTDVSPCPKPSEVSKYLSEDAMSHICKQAGFLDDRCRSHFSKGPAGNQNVEGFSAGDLYPAMHAKSSDPFDIMQHKDYLYSDPDKGHMPKSECYATFASRDASGKVVPCASAVRAQTESCRKSLTSLPISQHPAYEQTLLQFGAVKDRQGALIPAPICPGQNQSASVDNKSTNLSQATQTLNDLKQQFNDLLKKYKELTKQLQSYHTEDAKTRTDMTDIKSQLASIKSIIEKSYVTERSQSLDATSVNPPRYSSFVTNSPTRTRDTVYWSADDVNPLASADPRHGWIYT